jgi:hypothetical protein
VGAGTRGHWSHKGQINVPGTGLNMVCTSAEVERKLMSRGCG